MYKPTRRPIMQAADQSSGLLETPRKVPEIYHHLSQQGLGNPLKLGVVPE